MKIENTYQKLPSRFYSASQPARFENPKLLALNHELANDLGFDWTKYSNTELANIFSGQSKLPGSETISIAYAGHQFGHFVPSLGDGRAILIGEVKNSQGQLFDIVLKGAGPTTFSRNGDGFSALGPVLREYIVSEFMHHCSVPTTRALAAVATQQDVYREEMLPGGVFTRVASSHIRVGTFEYFAAREDIEGLRILLQYAIDRHYPHLNLQDEEQRPMLFFQEVIRKQIKLLTHWMSLGFIHGVMNTDNTSISGETIDYGPCAFMDSFHHRQVFSYIDRQGRYSYSNQPKILVWNMSKLGQALLPLLSLERTNQELSTISDRFSLEFKKSICQKLGVKNTDEKYDEKKSEHLISIWFSYLENHHLDFTLAYRQLASLLREGFRPKSFFPQDEQFEHFLVLWKDLLNLNTESAEEIAQTMDGHNPYYIPRNHIIEKVIERALSGDFQLFEKLIEMGKNPFTPRTEFEELSHPPKSDEVIQNTFCGT